MDDQPFFALVGARHCKRAFLDRPVARPLLERVLAAAANAPSSRNTQPWQVAIVTGRTRDALAAALCARYRRGDAPHPDFLNNPAELTGTAAERARACGAATLAIKGIDRHDADARRAHVGENFAFFGAPVAMVFHLPGDAVPGSFLAMGCFLQNVMLGLVASGLGSCPQYSVAGYADTVRQQLGLDPERLIVCGMSVGYVDPAAAINGLVPERAPLDAFSQWLD